MKLLLIPTLFERERIALNLRRAWTDRGYKIELCGFGIAIAGTAATVALQRWDPSEVILLGIAGGFAEDLSIGCAIEFARVSCYGIGVGTGDSFVSAGELNWLHWGGPPPIEDSILLSSALDCDAELLTVAAASQDTEDAKRRMKKYPSAIAEDMEGFSVAAACKLAGKPIRIVRGISNRVGDRDHRSWEIDRSLDAAMTQVLESTN
ncbi:futalosine hydrolase [Pirellulaceae bacterium SH501]